MNQRITTDSATTPNAASAHMALVIGIAHRGRELFKAIGETAAMSPDDQADVLGNLLDEHDAVRASIIAARDGAYRLAELESLLEGATP